MKIKTLLTVSLSAISALALTAPAQDVSKLPPVSPKTGVTYETDIKPILDKSCVKCHSGDHPKAKLLLDSLEGVLKGSRDGLVVIVGKSEKSDIILAPAHLMDDQDEWMPPLKAGPKFPALTPDQIGLLRAWVDQGAK